MKRLKNDVLNVNLNFIGYLNTTVFMTINHIIEVNYFAYSFFLSN
jgi:hypothetical protein